MIFKRGSGAAADAFARILANTGWLLGGKGVGAVLSLAYLAIVTRTLGVADFGRFALVLSAANVIKTLVSFDSWQIVVRYGQPHLAAGDGDALNRVLRFCILRLHELDLVLQNDDVLQLHNGDRGQVFGRLRLRTRLVTSNQQQGRPLHRVHRGHR